MAENDNIASNLNNLFGSNLFKENNFIKIYNLLGIHSNISNLTQSPSAAPPEAPPEAPAAPAPPAEIDNILGNFNYNNNDNKLYYDTTEINIFDDSKNLGIIIKKFIENITGFIEKKDAFKTKILDSIIIGDIVNELKDNDIIVDPAGLNYMKQNNQLNNTTGLSYALYNYIMDTREFYSPLKVKKHFDNFDNVTKLFLNNKRERNALFHEYNIHKHEPINNKASNPQVKIDNTITTLKLIHAIGPDYTGQTLTHIKGEYKKFMVLYNDIYIEYNNIKTIKTIKDKNLRLPLHSTGQFIGDKKNMNYILICLALAYLYIYCTINEGNKDEVKIYYLNNTDGNINNFKKILEKIIEKIIE